MESSNSHDPGDSDGTPHCHPIPNPIKRVLSPKHVNDLGRRVGFCYRERLITPCRLMRSLLAGHAMGRVETLADVHRKFHALFVATAAYKPVHDRLAKRSFKISCEKCGV